MSLAMVGLILHEIHIYHCVYSGLNELFENLTNSSEVKIFNWWLPSKNLHLAALSKTIEKCACKPIENEWNYVHANSAIVL